VANRDALQGAIGPVVGSLAQGALTKKLDEARIAWARMNTMPDFLAHPQLWARGRWHDVETPAGRIRALAPPVTIDGAPPRMDAVPALGQHTATILAELGYDHDAIARWRTEGTI